GFSREVWSKLAELGLLALQAPESLGGMAPASVETLLTATAIGKAMLLEPYVSSALIATALVRELDPENKLLEHLMSGAKIAVVAHFETGWSHEKLHTTVAGGGRKPVVLHAPAADVLLVSTSDESVYAVPRESAKLTAYRTLDGNCAADVAFDRIEGEL